jgi:hypothetical protein
VKLINDEYTQSKKELEQHLKDKIEAIELSSKAYDEGHEGAAKSLAADIRILVHDKGVSKSLLGQLGQKTIQFYDTSLPLDSNAVLTYNGFVGINLTTQGAKYVALLDELATPPRWVNFDEWWNKVIFIDNKGIKTTRKDLVCSVANKDGGAHVDPVLDEKYENLSRRNSLAWRFSGSKQDFPLEGPEKATIRQIAHEVLKSLNPKMPHMKPKIEGTIFHDVRVEIKNTQSSIPKVGPNTFCPCGSGKKYKKCHGNLQ